MTHEILVGFNGGPMDEIELEGIFARVIAAEELTYVCMFVDGRHEHYIRVKDCAQHPLCYEHAGPCTERHPHPPCGHDHSGTE